MWVVAKYQTDGDEYFCFLSSGETGTPYGLSNWEDMTGMWDCHLMIREGELSFRKEDWAMAKKGEGWARARALTDEEIEEEVARWEEKRRPASSASLAALVAKFNHN